MSTIRAGLANSASHGPTVLDAAEFAFIMLANHVADILLRALHYLVLRRGFMPDIANPLAGAQAHLS